MNTESMFNGMRRGKADRWDRMAERAVDNHNGAFPESMIAQLLRREHRAVLRAIEKYRESAAVQGSSCDYDDALFHILDILKARAR